MSMAKDLDSGDWLECCENVRPTGTDGVSDALLSLRSSGKGLCTEVFGFQQSSFSGKITRVASALALLGYRKHVQQLIELNRVLKFFFFNDVRKVKKIVLLPISFSFEQAFKLIIVVIPPKKEIHFPWIARRTTASTTTAADIQSI